MLNLTRYSLTLLISLLSLSSIYPEESTDALSGSASLGYFSSNGNSDSTNLNADLKMSYSLGGRWTHKLKASAMSANNEEVSSAERYFLAYQADFAMNARSFLFARVEAEKDRFSAYDLRTTESAGYGYKLFDTDTRKWIVEAGVGATQLKPRNGLDDITSAIALLATEYVWKLSKTAEFSQTVDYEIASDNKFLNSVTSLRASVWEDFGIRVSYNIKNNSDVPVGVENTDTFTSIGLDYSF
ncbi:MAG: DUF481 domain-containing protein [Gammaproteobacteria bacterium]|nr:DUF481 domain-containing protein [Gammaproteobacteria bacterium]NNM14193.1 DUF481 domain-containing protein [Gammaproteobacteria bacterium]